MLRQNRIGLCSMNKTEEQWHEDDQQTQESD